MDVKSIVLKKNQVHFLEVSVIPNEARGGIS